MVVALSKRSWTAVYSGKKAAGQKGESPHPPPCTSHVIAALFLSLAIPSLFDLCMKVLVNNIEGKLA